MKFGRIARKDAVGAMLAHAISAGERRFRKAHVLSKDDLAVLEAAGVGEVVAAVLAPTDITEDRAAERLARAMRFRGVEAKPASAGRVNLHAVAAGVFTVDKALIDAVNAIDPAMTVATLAQHATVQAEQMVATVKIIPFAVSETLVEAAEAMLAPREIFSVHAFRPRRAGLIQTVLPTVKDSVLDKTVRVTAERLSRSQSAITGELRVDHDAASVAAAITAQVADNDIVLVFGASALCDFDDVIPAAIRLAGGEVVRAGMPVDPGNLLVLGRLAGKPIVGAPGCARSPKENGFDWVLDRLISGLDVSGADISAMGVGGLLMEIPTRPRPRELPREPVAPDVHAIVLAAGRSSRMGGPNKLVATFSGKPLIRQTAERVLASRASGVSVVVGHQAERLMRALDGLDIEFVRNPSFEEGISTSIKAGIGAAPTTAAGALIVLGDMPAVSTADLDLMIGRFTGSGGLAVVRATYDGKRGNPVLLPRAMFDAVKGLEGDAGARHIIESGELPVIDVEIGEGARIDVDTPEALLGAGGVLQD